MQLTLSQSIRLLSSPVLGIACPLGLFSHFAYTVVSAYTSLTSALKLVKSSAKDIDIKEIGLRPGEKMFEELALEIEKCHKTDNNLIFVHERMELNQDDIDNRVRQLYEASKNSLDTNGIKVLLMELIKD